MGNGGSAPPMTLGGTALPLRIVPLKGRRLAGVFIRCPRPSPLRVILGYVNVPALPGCPATLEKHREAWSEDTRQALECSQPPQGLSPSLLPKPAATELPPLRARVGSGESGGSAAYGLALVSFRP